MAHYLRIWLASARYAVTRTLMFRFDFILWSTVELLWMAVNLLLISVIYEHTDSIAGWSKYETMLLVGTAMLMQRFLFAFFWSSLFEMGRNIRTGNFDFFLAQPGNVLFMASTRKLDLDSLANTVVAAGVVVYATHQLGLQPGAADIALYGLMLFCGIVIHFSALVVVTSLSFWLTSSQGIEGSYFTLFEFSRIPRQAFKGAANVVFVWILPAVLISNIPSSMLIKGFHLVDLLWLVGIAVFWFALAMIVFNRGLRRYSSASS